LPRGSVRRVEITRRDGRVASADLWRWETLGDKSLNPYLMDGDTVRVPFADVTVHIEGAVKRSGTIELIATKDLAELLDAAGGLRPDATRSLPIRVVHRTNQEQQEQITLPFGVGGSTPNVSLHDGDSVFVPTITELQRSILLVGPIPGASAADEITATKRLPFVSGMMVRATVESNGPLGASADLKNAYIKPEKGDVIPVDLEALLVRRDFSADRPLHIGDTIVIPQRRRAISVEGAAVKPGVYPYNPRFTMSEYLALAGGPSRLAQSTSSFRLVKPDGTLHRLDRGVGIEPGDTIMLPERAFSRTEVVQLVMGGVGLLLSGAALVILVVR
jgi:protein involved in polysaccharide export with SLBB domain